jgi:catalase
MTRDDSPRKADASERYDLRALLTRSVLTRLAVIGLATFLIAACFAWTGNWLPPRHLDQTSMIDTFEAVNGPHPGFRRNHAKGVCLTGWFDSNGAGARLSKAVVFGPGRVPVTGRFALAGGMPLMPDRPNSVRSMALNFELPDGEVWRTGMNDIPVFVVKDAQAFHDQLVATKPDATTGKPDPEGAKAFLAAHPETVAALAIIKMHPFSSGFADATYNSLDAFRLTNSAGVSTPVRWSVQPVDAFAPEPPNSPDDKDYLFDALIARVHKAPAQWRLILTIGQPGDPTNDATIPWPADRERVDAGTLTVAGLEAEAPGNCRDINFDPLVLRDGIAPSDDPLLSARSAAYSVSFTRRAGEAKIPSAVHVVGGGT